GRERGVLDPLRAGQRLDELVADACERGRARGAREDVEALSALASGGFPRLAQGRDEGGAVGGDATGRVLAEVAGAPIGVVELEDARLGVGRGATPRVRVIGVALDLDGPAVDAGDRKTDRVSAQLEGGAVAL